MDADQTNSPPDIPISQYSILDKQFAKTGITYKSNEIIHKICEQKSYPYLLLAQICKIFHFNQFEIIFLCHLLHDQQCSYRDDPAIFGQNHQLPLFLKIYNKITENGNKQIPIAPAIKNEIELDDQQQDEEEIHNNIEGELGLSEYENGNYPEVEYWTWDNLRQLYIYLLIIGYSVKYYLNQNVKPYEQEIKLWYPAFFTSVFNSWVDKYSGKVLRTNPKRINQFYNGIFQGQDNFTDPNLETDCQYRNYNQIVAELIKATTQNQEIMYEQRQL